MLFESTARLLNDVGAHSRRLLKNALIETFTVHARAVSVFI